MHEMTKCKYPSLCAGMRVILCCVRCWIWGQWGMKQSVLYCGPSVCFVGYQQVLSLRDWTFRPWQIATVCVGHPDIITDKPPHALFIVNLTPYLALVCLMQIFFAVFQTSIRGENSLRRVCCSFCDVVSSYHHLLSLETGIFITLWELQHPSSLSTPCSLSISVCCSLPSLLISGACQSVQTGLGFWTNLCPQVLNFWHDPYLRASATDMNIASNYAA